MTRAFLLLFVITACTSEPAAPTFPELEMLDTTPDPACTGEWVAAVTGRIVDEGGAGVGEAIPQMCVRLGDGTLNCLAPEPAREDGYFARIIDDGSRCMSELNFRALLPGSSFGTTYCHSDLQAEDGILSIPEALILYEVEPAAALPPEGNPEEPRTVVLADGLEIDARPAPMFGTYESFGGTRIDETTCFSGSDLDGLYALTPESATFRIGSEEAGFPVRIPTTLAEGTTVDLLVLGGLDEFELPTGQRLTEGAFEVFGTGTVVDGMVVSDPGSELPYISWLGYRAQ
ncbi:MAG: hypothetical protein AB8H86_00505 [Polyangiales bacterium]